MNNFHVKPCRLLSYSGYDLPDPDSTAQILHNQFKSICRKSARLDAQPQLLHPLHAEHLDQAKAILRNVGRHYRLKQAGQIPIIKMTPPSWLMGIASNVCAELRVYVPFIYMFRPAEANEKHHEVFDGDCSGAFKHFTRSIYIRSGLPRYTTLVVLGHELHHHLCAGKNLPQSERDAENFGQRVAMEYA